MASLRTARKSLRNREGKVEHCGEKITLDVVPRRNVWEYGRSLGMSAPDFPAAHNHPAIFPLALAKDHIRTRINPGDTVLDPMAGSGTVLRAAKDLGREYVGIEIYEPYVDLIQRRLAQQVLL